MIESKKIPLIVIQGPTAAGKSRIALDIAEALDSSIISADSRQVYKYMDIGTAKPSSEDQNKTKHHLIDIVKPDEDYSAGSFAADAVKIINQVSKQKKIPIVCGGTGFYIKALLEGIFKAPEIPEEIRKDLRRSIIEKGTEYFYNKLTEIDPESAARINENDSNRILRALEIYRTTGKTITQLWKEDTIEEKNFQTVNILVTENRGLLYNRINDRVDTMIDRGLLNEMEDLMKKGYKKTDPGMNSVGYKEFYPFLAGDAEIDECIDKIKQNTRNFAKRQFTWYRKIDFDLTLDSKRINFSNIVKEIKQKMQENK